MRTPPPVNGNDAGSGSREPTGSGRARADARGSSLVVLQPAADPPPGLTSPDDSPTVITAARSFPPADPSLGLAPGVRLGSFEVIEAVGAGGMAAVLKARDLDLGREVALKILPPHMARDPENVARFKLEARAAARLDHDCVARVFACGEDAGLHFIAFEFVEGETLRALIERRGVLAAAECARHMIQVAAGLAHAAERGVVHRDIKPSNIMVTPGGRAKIVDMGLARSQTQGVDGGVTQSGVTLGTFDYISPEQALDPRRADVRSDIYSLGCTFYHALTGRPPVPAGTPAKKLHAHQHEPVIDPRALNPAVPDELAVVLARMMAKNPARRFQTPGELIVVLTALAQKLNLSLGTDVMPALDPGAVPDPSSVRLLPEPPRVPAGLLVGIAAVVVAVVVLVSTGSSGPDRADGWVPWEPAPTPVVAKAPEGALPPLPDTGTGSPEAPLPTIATSRDELVQLLRNPNVTEIRLTPGQRYDLTDLTDGVVVTGRRLVIDGGSVDRPDLTPVIRVAAATVNSADHAAPRAGSLTVVKADSVRVAGVRFEVASGRAAAGTGGRAAGVLIADAGTVELSECRFSSEQDSRNGEAAGLAVVRSAPDQPTAVSARHCYFGPRRGRAVELTGRITADVAESAFAPGSTAFALRAAPSPQGSDPTGPSDLTLRHCTFLLENGAVAEAEPAARWRVSAGFCVFAAKSPPPADTMMMAPAPDRPDVPAAVLRSPAAYPPGLARFAGRAGEPNGYYRVAPYVLGRVAYTFAELAEQRPAAPVADPAAVELAQHPWAEVDPVAALQGAEPWKAFRLNPAYRPIRAVPPAETILGVRELPRPQAWVYSPWPPPHPDTVVNPKVKVFYPDMTDEERDTLPRNVYRKLQSAVSELEPGDELLLKFNGVHAIPDQISFPPNVQLRATVRPAPGYQPVLAVRPNRRFEPTLFRVTEGEVTFEGVEFLLRKDAEDAVRSIAAITVVAGRQCVLRNCVVTADELADEKVAAVVLADPSSEMMPTAGVGTGPRVRLENCLVRGKGRAVWVQSARPFELDVRNSMTVLEGPVVAIDPAARTPVAGSAVIQLDRVTAALGGPLLDLRPGRASADDKPASWVPVEVRADRCLFAAWQPGVPVVTVDGGDPDAPARTFTWAAGGGPNWYANFGPAETFLEIIPADDTALMKSVDADGWFALTGEKPGQSVGSVTFVGWPAGPKKPTEVLPADLRPVSVTFPMAFPKPTPGDAGAPPAALPKPAPEFSSEP